MHAFKPHLRDTEDTVKAFMSVLNYPPADYRISKVGWVMVVWRFIQRVGKLDKTSCRQLLMAGVFT